MDRKLKETTRLGEPKPPNHDPKDNAKQQQQQQHSFKRKLRQTDSGDHSERKKKKKKKLEETTQLGDSTKRKPPQKDPEISAEKKRKKKKKNKDRDSMNGDNAEQQQRRKKHSLLITLDDIELSDHLEQQRKKKKNQSSEEEEVSDFLYKSSEEEEVSDYLYKSSEEEEEEEEEEVNVWSASKYHKLDWGSYLAFVHRVKEIIPEQKKLDDEKRLACEAKGETYISDAASRFLVDENFAEIEERYCQMVCASEGFHVCDEATKGLGYVGHIHYVEIEDDLIDAARFAVERYNNKADREGKERLEFERLLRATRQDQRYRLTLECTDGQFYEADVWWSVFGLKKSKTYFLRRAKYYPAILCCT